MANQLVPENVVRKLDNLGRVTLPKGLRDRMFLGDNAELEIYTARIDGRECICLAQPMTKEMEIQSALDIFNKYNMEVEITNYGEDNV